MRGMFRISAGTDTFLIRSNKILLITLILNLPHRDNHIKYSESHFRLSVTGSRIYVILITEVFLNLMYDEDIIYP